MSRYIPVLMAFFAFLPLKLEAAPEPGDPAARQIETFYAALIDNMKSGPELGIQGRYRQLQPAAEATFDLAGMARLTVGPAWTSMSETDHKAITEAFGRLTLATYAKNFAKFGGEQFVVDPMVNVRNEDKIIESKLVRPNRPAVSFNYRMRMEGDKWKVIDVFLNGYVSQVALRRADFSSTVASSGASGLVTKIDELTARQMAGGN